MKTSPYIFLCQRFVISHTTDFQRPLFGDTKYFITEVQGFYRYFTRVWYEGQNVVHYHHSYQTVSFLKRNLLQSITQHFKNVIVQ